MTASLPEKIDRIESVLLTLSDETAHLATEVRALGVEVKALGTEVRTGFAELKEVAIRQERNIDRLVGVFETLVRKQESA